MTGGIATTASSRNHPSKYHHLQVKPLDPINTRRAIQVEAVHRRCCYNYGLLPRPNLRPLRAANQSWRFPDNSGRTSLPWTQYLLCTVLFIRRSIKCGFTSLAGRTDSPRGSQTMEGSAGGEWAIPCGTALRNIGAHGFMIKLVVVFYDALLLLQ